MFHIARPTGKDQLRQRYPFHSAQTVPSSCKPPDILAALNRADAENIWIGCDCLEALIQACSHYFGIGLSIDLREQRSCLCPSYTRQPGLCQADDRYGPVNIVSFQEVPKIPTCRFGICKIFRGPGFAVVQPVMEPQLIESGYNLGSSYRNKVM